MYTAGEGAEDIFKEAKFFRIAPLDKKKWQCWYNVVTIRNNVVTILQHCVALKIVVPNRHVKVTYGQYDEMVQRFLKVENKQVTKGCKK